ncbi:MAG: hypothetical protein JNN04_12510 [Cyclobacteriaceae bacterium]|nr:hypothetical protein [Cyclobacteriaceae bacterium]
MKKVLLSLAFFLSFLAARGQEKSPEALLAAWEKSWNTYDLKEVPRLFVADQSVTYFSSERAGLIQGIDSLIKHHRGFGFVEGGKTSANRLWLTDVRHRPLSATALWHFQRPGSPEQRGPVTFILQRSGEGYRIAHAHFSNDPKGR